MPKVVRWFEGNITKSIRSDLDKLAGEKPVEDEDFPSIEFLPVLGRAFTYAVISWCLAVFLTGLVALVRALRFPVLPPLVLPVTFFLVFGVVFGVLSARAHSS